VRQGYWRSPHLSRSRPDESTTSAEDRNWTKNKERGRIVESTIASLTTVEVAKRLEGRKEADKKEYNKFKILLKEKKIRIFLFI
jgi:hypothetical protein